MKIAGHVPYPFGAMSPNDPSGVGLGFDTQEQAITHCDHMNSLIQSYDLPTSIWDKSYWTEKPLPFVWQQLEVGG